MAVPGAPTPDGPGTLPSPMPGPLAGDVLVGMTSAPLSRIASVGRPSKQAAKAASQAAGTAGSVASESSSRVRQVMAAMAASSPVTMHAAKKRDRAKLRCTTARSRSSCCRYMRTGFSDDAMASPSVWCSRSRACAVLTRRLYLQVADAHAAAATQAARRNPAEGSQMRPAAARRAAEFGSTGSERADLVSGTRAATAQRMRLVAHSVLLGKTTLQGKMRIQE